MAAAAPASVRRQEHGGLRVVDPLADGVRREAAEDDAVGRPDAGAGEHGDRRLGHHGHVDGHAVPALDAPALEGAREAVDLAVEIPVREGARVARLSFPDEGGLGPPGGIDVAVEAVVGDVELAADEPLGVRRLPLEGLPPRLEPVELPGETLPEPDGVLRGLSVDGGAVDVGALGELLGRRILPLFLEEGLDGRGADRGLRRHGRVPHMSGNWAGRRGIAPAIF